MRFLRIPLISALFIIVLSGVLSAQVANVYLDCGSVSESTVDSIKILPSVAAPGDTVWVPFSMTTYDNPFTEFLEQTAGFLMLIQWDDTYLTPLRDPADTTNDGELSEFGFIDFEVVGRLKNTMDSLTDGSTAREHLFVQHSQNPFDSGAILVALNLGFSEVNPVMGPGEGVVFRIPFVVSAAMPENETADFRFYEINECIAVGADIFCADCRRSSLAIMALDSIYINDSTLILDTSFSVASNYPSLTTSPFTANSNPPPLIEEFILSSYTVSPGAAVVLSWSSSYADSIFVTGPGVNYESDLPSSFTAVTAPIAEGTYQYVIVGKNDFGEHSLFVNLVVEAGVIIDPTNTPPVLSVGSNYTVEEGQPLSFVVSASDADNDAITLSSGVLPNNASFTQQVGTGTVNSTFSWTPDIGQEGNYTVSFSANDGIVIRSVSVNISVTGITSDRLFSTSAPGLSPVGGLSGKENIFFPIDLVTAATVYGVQFDFAFDYNTFRLDSFVVTGRTPDYVVYDNIGQTPGLIKVVTFGLSNEPVVLDTTTAILYAALSIDSAAPYGDYPIYIQDGWESVNPDPSFPSLELLVDSGIVQVDRLGDVNLDKRIDVADLVSIVAFIIENFTFNSRQFDVADVLTNDTVNVFDLVGVINMIYGIPLSPIQGQPVYGEQATMALAYPDLQGGILSEIIVTSELPTDIAGVEIEILYDPQAMNLGVPIATADADGLTLRSRDDGHGKMTVLMHFKNPFDNSALISAGFADLVKIPVISLRNLESGDPASITLNRALLSTANAVAVNVEGFQKALPSTFVLKQNWPNPFNPTTTIEFDLGSSTGGASVQQVNLDIYNILGQHVKELVNTDMLPGSYKVEWDATSKNSRKVATGVYLYRLVVGNESKTKKMLLLK